MIKTKEKPCKGTGVANGYGCGKITQHRVYGLGKMCGCYSNWLINSELGKIKLTKAINVSKSNTKKVRVKELNDLKEKIRTKSSYEKELQKEINTIVRLIDKGFVCISSGKVLNLKYDAGHFFSVGSSPSIRFNLFNIYAQSVHSNQHLSGDSINFILGLRNLYSPELADYVLSLKGIYKVIKLSIEEIKYKIIISRKIVKELKQKDLTYNAKQRIELRSRYNTEIGIYLEDFKNK